MWFFISTFSGFWRWRRTTKHTLSLSLLIVKLDRFDVNGYQPGSHSRMSLIRRHSTQWCGYIDPGKLSKLVLSLTLSLEFLFRILLWFLLRIIRVISWYHVPFYCVKRTRFPESGVSSHTLKIKSGHPSCAAQENDTHKQIYVVEARGWVKKQIQKMSNYQTKTMRNTFYFYFLFFSFYLFRQ